MSPEFAIGVSLALPLAGALGVALAGLQPNLRETVTLTSATLLFLTVCSLVPSVFAGGRPELTLVTFFPAVTAYFQVEPLGLIFGLVASFLWIVTSIYSIGYMRGHGEKNQTRFYVCFAVAISSTMGVAFAGNMFTLYICYEVLTLSTIPLVAHAGTDEARRGGRVYLGILLGTSIAFLLLAIVWTWSVAGTLDFTEGGILEGKASKTVISVLLALYVFGIGKAALMPFHRWLPAAMVAPTPVSALLHAVAVVKAGVFTVLKVTVYIFGVDLLMELGSSQWLQYVAAATIIIASLVAMTKDNLKARLAYSTISQLSYIVLGAMLATSLGIVGGGLHLAMHAFGKITLFFCAGAFMVASHKTEVSQLRGIGRTMPLTTLAFLIGSLSVIGLPPMGGLWGKWFLMLGALDANQFAMVVVLIVSSLLNIVYLLPIPLRGFFGKPDNPGHDNPGYDNPGYDNPGYDNSGHDNSGHEDTHQGWVWHQEAPPPCIIAISISSIGCVVLFFFSDPIFDLLGQIVEP
jgi:multicomponent Na+:H+ antiporter subunit D